MTYAKRLTLTGTLLAAASVHADTVTGELVDTMPGKVVGGVSAFLLGGFTTGGPAGALLGGGIGWLLGDKSQEAIGMGDTAYRVTTSDGREVTVRSPNKSWPIGDEVRIVNKRLVAEPSALEVSSR